MNEWDDYYEEPNEFEEQIEEFKNSLYNCVKKEYKDRIEELVKENKELQEVKRNFNQIELEYKQKQRELERKIESAERDAKKLKLTDLMQELKRNLYQAERINVYNKKCDKCDEHRIIHFESPLGKEMTEYCECRHAFSKYEPTEYDVYSFQQNRENNINTYYKKKYKDEDYYCEDNSIGLKSLIKCEEDFLLIEKSLYNIFFISKELCQKYCDMKNKKNGITEDMTEEIYPEERTKKGVKF